MPDPSPPLTERAGLALRLAQDEARRFKAPAIGTTHLLLGVVRVGDGAATLVLHRLGVRLPKVLHAVGFVTGWGERAGGSELGLSLATRWALALAAEAARRCGRAEIDPDHLVLGLLQDDAGGVADVLELLGISPVVARAQALAAMGEEQTAEGRLPARSENPDQL
jgi:ATP-dependent Clp protease ATP-binding subunit ClpC